DARRVRYLALILSAFFAGIGGGLTAINFEIVSAENVGVIRSGTILLFTFIGGTGFFFGPVIGAVAGVLLTVSLYGYTPAWQLYLGLYFIVIVMAAPDGLAGLGMRILTAWRYGHPGQMIVRAVTTVSIAGLLLAGVILL